jgi:hypothetical protein
MRNDQRSILSRWGITEQELTERVDSNPSLRGILLGYVAEKKFHDCFLKRTEITEIAKDDDHDRKKKGDRRIGPGQWVGQTQVDGSDRRIVKFPDGTTLNTTLLLRGEFDLLAVNCFAFGDEWRFAFAKNSDLPCSTYRQYTKEQCSQLIASLIRVTWPPEPPFTDNLFTLLDELLSEASSQKT